MKKLNKVFIILRIFFWPIYLFVKLIKRNENIIVFGSLLGKRFADNPKYLYLFLNNKFNSNKKRYIWITKNKKIADMLRNKGLESYYLFSIKGIFFSIMAKYYIYDHKSTDICYWLSNGSIKINLWHGLPLKKIEYDMGNYSKYYSASNIKKIIYKAIAPWLYEKSDFILATSSEIAKLISSAFRVNISNIIISNYPRNIALFNSLYGEDIGVSREDLNAINNLKQTAHYKLLIYLPTYRDYTCDDFDKFIDLKALNEFCNKNKIIFIIKPHPSAKININNANLKNIFILEKFEDVYPYLRLSDVLITDYSSVFFDYYLTGKPIIFFWYDLEKYLSKNRQMYFNYNDVCYGWKAYNFSELISCIEEALNNPHKFKEQIQKNLNRFFEKYQNPEDLTEILNILGVQ